MLKGDNTVDLRIFGAELVVFAGIVVVVLAASVVAWSGMP